MILTRLPKQLALRLRSEIAVRNQFAIDELRDIVAQAKASAHLRPNLERVSTIVGDILTISDLDITAKAMGLDDDAAGQAMVLDVVGAFGTWLGHSIGTTETLVVEAATLEQLPLMQMPHLLTDAKTNLPTVVLPFGYEQAACGRDVAKALSLIAVYQPSAETISRFVSRTYEWRSAELTYPVIAGVWDFARRGRLHRIRRVSDDPVFHELVVEAYDLLEFARRDAVSALRQLSDPTTDPAELRRLAVQSRWLAQQDVARIERCLDHPGSDAYNLGREQQLLARRIETDPMVTSPESITELSLGQVLVISRLAGVKVSDDRATETEIRNELKALGLGTDTDRLLPEALRAASRGRLEEFWAAVKARVSGDPTWSKQLADVFSQED